MDTRDTHEQHLDRCCVKSFISWNGIIVGTLVATGLTILFHILTLGLGLASYTQIENGVVTLAIVAFGWLFIGGYVIYFIAGWVAGAFIYRYTEKSSKGFLQGFLTWTLALIVGMILMSNFIPAYIQVFSPQTVSSVSARINNDMSDSENKNKSVTDSDNKNKAVTEKTINKFGIATLSTFLIFLAGALGGGFGGHCAVTHYRKKMNNRSENRVNL